jgi:Fructose-2,6-bisphosphatase
MKTIITIQHTQSVHHNTGMVGSWTDWELTELGQAHAENIGRKLSAELKLTDKSYKLYSSDLIRAKQTIEPLARYMGQYNPRFTRRYIKRLAANLER